ncbi:hypothetical protein LJC15_00505 [Desulfovibrio sp. OttesenSCG-928-G11]|nr:hypothetical protein [Desulfovibrio sp. OttesenSCG-928-G11]
MTPVTPPSLAMFRQLADKHERIQVDGDNDRQQVARAGVRSWLKSLFGIGSQRDKNKETLAAFKQAIRNDERYRNLTGVADSLIGAYNHKRPLESRLVKQVLDGLEATYKDNKVKTLVKFTQTESLNVASLLQDVCENNELPFDIFSKEDQRLMRDIIGEKLRDDSLDHGQVLSEGQIGRIARESLTKMARCKHILDQLMPSDEYYSPYQLRDFWNRVLVGKEDPVKVANEALVTLLSDTVSEQSPLVSGMLESMEKYDLGDDLPQAALERCSNLCRKVLANMQNADDGKFLFDEMYDLATAVSQADFEAKCSLVAQCRDNDGPFASMDSAFLLHLLESDSSLSVNFFKDLLEAIDSLKLDHVYDLPLMNSGAELDKTCEKLAREVWQAVDLIADSQEEIPPGGKEKIMGFVLDFALARLKLSPEGVRMLYERMNGYILRDYKGCLDLGIRESAPGKEKDGFEAKLSVLQALQAALGRSLGLEGEALEDDTLAMTWFAVPKDLPADFRKLLPGEKALSGNVALKEHEDQEKARKTAEKAILDDIQSYIVNNMNASGSARHRDIEGIMASRPVSVNGKVLSGGQGQAESGRDALAALLFGDNSGKYGELPKKQQEAVRILETLCTLDCDGLLSFYGPGSLSPSLAQGSFSFGHLFPDEDAPDQPLNSLEDENRLPVAPSASTSGRSSLQLNRTDQGSLTLRFDYSSPLSGVRSDPEDEALTPLDESQSTQSHCLILELDPAELQRVADLDWEWDDEIDSPDLEINFLSTRLDSQLHLVSTGT